MVGMALPPREVKATPRSRVYGLVKAGFQYPSASGWQPSSAWASELEAACQSLSYAAPRTAVVEVHPNGLEDLQVAYTGLFDAGPGGVPCSLYGGHYESDRLRVMEEALRFYDFFGLRFERGSGLFPDHIIVQLEFMEYLAMPPAGVDLASALRAQRDFLQRHLLRWVPQLARGMEGREAPAFFRELVAFSESFLAADALYVRAALAATESGRGEP
jgi:putative dimethyl sulfoxide reductase chaperone